MPGRHVTDQQKMEWLPPFRNGAPHVKCTFTMRDEHDTDGIARNAGVDVAATSNELQVCI